MNPRQPKEINAELPKPNFPSAIKKSKYAYEKLRVCSHCGSYTVLQETECTSCGKTNLRPITLHAEKVVRRSMRNELWLILFVMLVAILFSRDAGQIALSCVCGAVVLVVVRLLQRKTLDNRTNEQLIKHFVRNRQRIIDGLIKNLDTAVEVGNNKDHRRSYEMFRQVSSLVRNDHIRMLQIIQLQSYVLRSDMDLELEPLLLKHFDGHLAAYIGEIAKVNRELIKDKTFRYVIKYENEILKMKDGSNILIGVAGAAVRKKRYVVNYADFVARYARKLPKDRFLRLYRVISGHPEQHWGELGVIVSQYYEEKYEPDREFQSSLTRGHSI
ncbi:hypothetical protein [Paenibacillus segetis]|uniref:Zinc ribbon domain-containing protein n=1 Tax=Paenibacillus segetis TaxID=1325360 RepID=A0ABQ1YFD9_9BACL|nr:hypothetical protein [Paenibacillus segetis]GGH23031.1 hypothetical protein GCM10008013_21850 [Paenibacillus segetis]